MTGRASLAGVLALLGCEGPDLGFPWDFERMLEQPRYEAYAESEFFEDRRAMRRPPPGTVPYAPGPPPKTPRAEEPAAPAPDLALLERGRERYGIFCAPCHGLSGHADTPVARSMSLRPPPSLHQARVRRLDPAMLHRVVREGYGLMPSYAELLGEREQWAVAYYVRALQLSQRAPLAELPAGLREKALEKLGEDRP